MIRVQKYLADAGVASRRKVEGWIAAGRLTVNGRAAVPGLRVAGGERFRLDGRPLPVRPSAASAAVRVIAYNKPEGELVTRDRRGGHPTVFAALPRLQGQRWVAVGRLDLNSSGLLLLTTDGQLAHRLMHPSFGIEREYLVRVLGQPGAAVLQRLTGGVMLDDGPARFDSLAEQGGSGANRWYRAVLSEGRHRVVRRLWSAQGYAVSRLIRIRYGPARLPRDLPRGRWRELDPALFA
ncbi:MAG: pseudouridine synthase [Gammaproteobacteria bacterium]|nr:pseudouridine synthase [Gammaproteobacteria bacterium]MCY4164682.1 pseudouridine synthase [Gammaproteobacteria bacterium]MCY4340084.1 pseudouridine synthase [Gammaproteobacteria bacterium]